MKNFIGSMLIVLAGLGITGTVRADSDPLYTYIHNAQNGYCYYYACYEDGCLVVQINPCPKDLSGEIDEG